MAEETEGNGLESANSGQSNVANNDSNDSTVNGEKPSTVKWKNDSFQLTGSINSLNNNNQNFSSQQCFATALNEQEKTNDRLSENEHSPSTRIGQQSSISNVPSPTSDSNTVINVGASFSVTAPFASLGVDIGFVADKLGIGIYGGVFLAGQAAGALKWTPMSRQIIIKFKIASCSYSS